MSLITKRPAALTVEEKICLVIAKCQRVSVTEVQKARSLDDLHIDSLDALNIIFSLEEEFKISIKLDVNRISTLQDLFALVGPRSTNR